MSSSGPKYTDVQTASVITRNSSADDANTPSSLEVEISFVRGEIQEPAYRDKWFGIAFLAHLGAMIAVAAMYANGTLETEAPNRRLMGRLLQQTNSTNANGDDPMDEDDFAVRFFGVFLLSLIIAPTLSVLCLGFMAKNAQRLIELSLYFGIGFNAIVALLLFATSDPVSGILPAFFAAILVCYTKAVWHRIPYAAANLKTAIACVQSNLGMAFLGLTSIPLLAVWVVLWVYVASCVLNSPWMKSQEEDVYVTVTDDQWGQQRTEEEEKLSPEGTLAWIGLLLSFYWTFQVIKNVVHTTLAGTVGTWWFLPQEANSCCSRGLTDSLSRSLTYSFGSICLGSLIVAIIEVLKSLLRGMARNRRGGVLRLIAQCLLTCIERIAEYFNKWAFIYVGLYGYSYVEAGKNVFTLFRNRGWSTIISDALVNRMLGTMCFCIGLINALISAILTVGTDSGVIGFSAFMGFFNGVLLSSLAFGVVVSAVDSIIVLYAEAPAEFKDNHPALAQEMEETWTQAWPDIFTPTTPAVASPVL